MKAYLDKNNRLAALEILFDKDSQAIKKVNFKNETKMVYLNEKQYLFITKKLNEGFSLDDFLYDNGEIKIEKQEKEVELSSQPIFFCDNRTVIVDLQKFRLNADLKRHLKNNEDYRLVLKNDFDFSLIENDSLYLKDKYLIDVLKNKDKQLGLEIPINLKYSFFVLQDKNKKMIGYVLLLLNDLPTVAFFHSYIENGGYFLIFQLILLLKQNGYKYLDLGGLTKEESGINQFKNKWGSVIKLSDLFLFK